MKIFTAAQIRAGDAFTIKHDPVSSIDLMERAADKCVDWLLEYAAEKQPFYLFCGMGNNGGDGLAIARILKNYGREIQVYLVRYSPKYSEDCQVNKERLEHSSAEVLYDILSPADWPEIPENALIVDALFGTGLNRPLRGFIAQIAQLINRLPNEVVAIDMPSGLQAEKNPPDATIIQATHTLSFEFHKLAFLLPDKAGNAGNIHILSIGIHSRYIQQTPTPYHLTTKAFVKDHLIKRNGFSHKGTYGHALIIAGSHGKTGAAVLATRAALHSGAGLVSAYIPKNSYLIMQISVPEAMCFCDVESDYLSYFHPEIKNYNTLGIGPGIGKNEETHRFLKALLKSRTAPLVIDADALNLISLDQSLFESIPKNSILTPHPKEFERLFGSTGDAYERLQLQIEKSKTGQVVIVLKGHHTCVTTPDGEAWFNTTGNAGMATGGSGDVLTGLLTGLLAQGYEPAVAAISGVWLHGQAGDLALRSTSMESLTASDLIMHLGKAFNSGSD